MQNNFKSDFPLLKRRLENGKPLVYLDNAATTQKPDCVIEAVSDYYQLSAANPHRGAYSLSADATALYEDARKKTAQFIHAFTEDEIVFTKNATEAFNLIALSYGNQHVKTGDEILISIAEHHANLLPWQSLANKQGATLKYMDIDGNGVVSLDELEKKINQRTKIVAITQISNVLGIQNPVKEMIRRIHDFGAVVVVDGAQSVPHIPVNVQELDADFMVFSGHKMLAPEGIGVLYGKQKFLDSMEPLLLGGGIVEQVTEQTVRFLEGPLKFEAGTPNVAGAVGLGVAMEYIEGIGFETIGSIELELMQYMLEGFDGIPDIEIYGNRIGREAIGVIPFNIKNVHPHDVATVLDADGVTIRAGHHCAQPLMQRLGIHSCCRASLYFYNTREDVDKFIEALRNVKRWLGV